MKKNKKQKNKKIKTAKKPHKKSAKKARKGKLKVKVKVKAKPKFKATKRKVEEAIKTERLITRGKERGFVTYDEILREFPTIETDIIFLDDLYEKLHTLGIDILEGGGLLEVPEEESNKKYAYSRGDSSYDSIQMYLREI